MAIDLTSLTSDDIAALKAALGMPNVDASGRSPARPRQLHDLTLLPTKDDPRPTFFWSAEKPRGSDTWKVSTYPRLMWEASTGREIAVANAAEQATYTARGFVLSAPENAEAPDPVATMQAQLAQLSDADRKQIFEDVETARLARIKAQMGELSDEARAALIAGFAEQPKVKRTA